MNRKLLYTLTGTLLAGQLFGQSPDASAPHNQYGIFEPIPEAKYIPVNDPKFIKPSESKLGDKQLVLGLTLNGESRCYPIRQMVYHHVVNDQFGGRHLAITYCGLANTAMTFDNPADAADTASFRAAGMFGGMLALCEQKGDETWPQIADVPLPDRGVESRLDPGPQIHFTTFGAWKSVHPDTAILAEEPEYKSYYDAYDKKPKNVHINPMVNDTILGFDPRLAPETDVFGVAAGGEACAWTVEWLKQRGETTETLAGKPIHVIWDTTLQTPRVDDPTFEGYATRSYWYAWGNFHPETRLVGESQSKGSADEKAQ